jgi:hypothetical protein
MDSPSGEAFVSKVPLEAATLMNLIGLLFYQNNKVSLCCPG